MINDIPNWVEEEKQRRNNFFKVLGEPIKYLHKDCIECGRHRVELWTSGKEICDKCGFEQNDKEFYSNEYGRYSEYVL